VRRPEGKRTSRGDDGAARAGLQSYLFGLGVAFLLAVALSWSYSTSARLGYRIESLKREIASLETVQEKLSFELSGLRSMARIESEATKRLGLVRPDYVRVGAGAAGTQAPSEGAAAPGSVARVIYLTDAGSNLASGAGAAGGSFGSESGLIRSLWDRLYRWLTGVSQAEAHSRD
jgi:hypothetical protein